MAILEKLPCHLTPNEKVNKGRELAELVEQRDAVEYEAKEIAAKAKKRLKKIDKKGHELAEEIRSGVEYRDVECIERVNFDRNTMETMRLDTGEIAHSRPLKANERQSELRFPYSPPDNSNATESEPDSGTNEH